jgi:GxxExxY protein
MDITLLCKQIIGCAFKVHNQLGFGFLEKVYENALAFELSAMDGIHVEQQFPIPVYRILPLNTPQLAAGMKAGCFPSLGRGN